MKSLKVIESIIKEDKLLLNEKDLVMAIIALQHLDNENNFSLGAEIFIVPVTTLLESIIDVTAGKVALSFVAGGLGIKLVLNVFDKIKINKLKNMLVEELMDRFETPQLAYLEISQLITSVTREEILEYLNSIGCEYNA